MSQLDDFFAERRGAPAGAASATPDLDTFFAERRQAQAAEQEARIRKSIEFATKDDPELAAERRRLSQTSGLPINVVERNLEELRAKETAKAYDLVRLAKTSPILYRQLTDPQFTAESVDDIFTLENLERSVGKGVRYVMGADAKGGLPSDIKGAAVTLGAGVPLGVGKMAFDVAGTLNDLLGWQSGAEAARTTAKRLGDQLRSVGFEGGTPTREAIKSGLESTAVNLALLPIGLYRGLYATANQAAATVAGLMATGVGAGAYNKAREQGLNQLQSTIYAIPEGTFEYVFERIPAAKLFGDLAANTGLLRLIGRQTLSEGWTEQVTTLAQDFNEWMNLNQDKTLAQFIQERPEAAYQTFIATLVGVGVQTSTIKGINKIVEAATDRSLQFDQDLLQQQLQLAAASTLRARSPEQFRTHIQRVVDANEGAKSEIYVDAEVLNQLPQELLAQLPESVREALPGALETNSTVAIPMADVLTVAPGTELEQILNDNARMRPNAASRVEAQLTEQFLQQEADRVLQQAADTSAWQQSSQAVQQTILDQLNTAGRFTPDVNEAYATLQANFFSTMAARVGLTPQELYNRYQLRVSARQPGGQVLNADQTTTPEFRTWFGESKVVDAQGAPLVVYHGTDRSFDTFSLNFRNENQGNDQFGPGYYTTTSATGAGGYANGEGANILPLYISLQNPIDLDTPGFDRAIVEQLLRASPDFANNLMNYGDVEFEGEAAVLNNAVEAYLSYDNAINQLSVIQGDFWPNDPEGFLRAAKEITGHDGVVVDNGGAGQFFVAWTPEQIKSAIGNRGTFDPASGNILEQRGVQAKGKAVPTTVDEVSNVESAFQFAGGQTFGNNREFKLAIQERVQAAAKAAKVKLDEFTQGVEDYLVRVTVADAITALRTNPNAVGWYNEKVTKALRLVSLIHPEINTDPQAKFAFVWALAVTSNDMKVGKNFELAERAYAGYKATGQMPTDIGEGTAKAAIDEGLRLYNEMLAQHGFEALERFMTTKATVKEIQQFSNLKVTGENLTTEVYGSAILGPKIGNGFFSNLYGHFEQLTMDRWLMRTWGRWTGTLIEFNPAQVKAKRTQLKALIQSLDKDQKKAFEAIIKRKLTVSDLDGVAAAIQKASTTKAARDQMARIGLADNDVTKATLTEVLGEPKKGQVRISLGDEMRKAGNALTKYLDGQKEAPSGPPERGNIRKVFSRALGELQREYPALTMSDLQALLWYPEKRLYDAAKAEEEGAEGYADDEAPDYANAAADLARKSGVADADIARAIQEIDNELQTAERARATRRGAGGPAAGEGIAAAGEPAADAGQPGVLNQEPLAQGPRGTFSPEQLLVTLNENADLSTFLHESGHFFLEVLADLASQSDTPQQIRDDMKAVLQWFGVRSLATWNQMTLDEKRPYHERWAESFEQYLFEGKAPSPELQPLFRRFRSWLINVYQSLTAFMRGRNLKVSDEIRQVFDRMIATDEQIAQAEEAAGMLPDFEATNEAIEALQARSLRDLKWTIKARSKALKALEKEAATLRKEVEAEVRAEVEQQPLYKAMNWLKKGETTDPATGDLVKAEKGFRLSTAALAEMYPETMLGRPDLTRLRGMTGKEGLHPDMVADMFGFESGDQLVRAILDAEPIASVIEGITDQRMLERHGDLATPEAREAAANEAVHNEARARSLATELKSQADMMNQRQDTGRTATNGRAITVNAVVEAAKQFALNLAARRRLKDLKNAAWQHRSAEARAGKRWQQLTAEGKTEEAVQAKRDQLLNNYAAKALQDAQVEVRKTLEFFKRVVKGNDEKIVERGRDPDVVNAMRAILAAYDVAPRLEKSALAYMEVVAKNDPAMYSALKPGVDAALLNAKPLTEMTLEELRGLNDELRAMWVLAKRSRQMEVDGNLLDIEEAADELVTRMDEIGIPVEIPGERGAITDKQEAGIKLRFALSILTRVEQWAERLDGRFGGPFLRLVFQPVKDAADRFRTDRVAYRKQFTELLKNVAPFLPQGPIAAPELGYTFGNARDSGAAELLHAILHTGNDSNKRKLLLGRGWATQNADGTLDTSRWDAFIQRLQADGVLRKEHYDFAQGVWDLLEQMKPLAQETHRKVFGRYFAEVTANEVVTPFGTYRGGYVPAQTDSRLVKDAKLRELAEGENESMAYAFPAAPSGFTKSRVEYNQPLLLDLRALAQHMDKVLLFSHMQGAVTDVRRLLTNKRVSYALDRIDPGAYEGMLIPWLNRAARQVVETPVVGDRKLSRFLSAARSRAGMALMFANLSNTFQQITGFSMAAVKVKPGLMLQATAAFIADPKGVKKTVAEASPYMKDRMLNEVSAMNDAVEEILVNPTLLQQGQAWTQRHAYFMQAAVDNTMSPIIWTAAYNQAIAEGQTERDAVRFADSVVRQTQGTTLPEDVSRFETGPGYARLFTQFVSYFNMMANTNATAVSQIVNEMGLRKGAGRLLYVALAGLLVPIWVAEAIAQAFRGGPEDEEGDGWLDDWLMAVFGLGTIRGLVAQVPIAGQAAQLVVNRFNDNPADDKFSLSPAVSLIESAVSSPASVYKAVVDGGSAQKAVRDVATAATLITGLPIFTVGRPLGYLAGMADDRIEPTGPADLARGLVTGTASPESKDR